MVHLYMNFDYKTKYLKYKSKYTELKKQFISNKQVGGLIKNDVILLRDIMKSLIIMRNLEMDITAVFCKAILSEPVEFTTYLSEQNTFLNNMNPAIIDIIGVPPESKDKITNKPDSFEDSGDYTWIIDLTQNMNYWCDGPEGKLQVFDSIYFINSFGKNPIDLNKIINFIRDNILVPNPEYNLYVAIGAGLTMDFNLPEFIVRDVEHGQRYIILIIEAFTSTMFVDSTNFFKPLGYMKNLRPELFSNIKCYFVSWHVPIESFEGLVYFLESIESTHKNYFYYGINTCGKIYIESKTKSPVLQFDRVLHKYTIIGCDGYLKPSKEGVKFEDTLYNTEILEIEKPTGLTLRDDWGVNLSETYSTLSDDFKYRYYYRTGEIE